MQRGGYRNHRGGYRGGAGGGGGRAGGRAGGSTQLKGLFENGVWKCNCSPRLIAEHFKTKKEGPNKGRWFYTCQKDQKERCGFFLWDDEAQPRMQAAVINNSHNEPRQDAYDQEGWVAGRKRSQGTGMFAGVSMDHAAREDSPTTSPSPSPTPASAGMAAKPSKKRTASDAQLHDDQQPWSLTGAEEKELAMATGSSTMSTPQKAQKIGVYATPTTSSRRGPRILPWLQEPVTPSTGTKPKGMADYFTSPTKQVKFAVPDSAPDEASSVADGTVGHVTYLANQSPDANAVTAPDTPQAPPTPAAPVSPSPPARFKDALVNPADFASSLTSEVFAELSSIRLYPEQHTRLRDILEKHDLQKQGVTMGRDVSRLSLKSKNAKIVELEAKIASLEAERERDRAVIASLKWRQENTPGDGNNDDDDEEL